MPDDLNYVEWFRHSSPYINAHREKTFVIFVPGEAVESSQFSNIISDLSLMDSLGVRLVIVHGSRPQIDRMLTKHEQTSAMHAGSRITPKSQLQDIIQASAGVRIQIEAQLSMALANTSMAGSRLKVCSGNYVIARPLGVVDGIDFGHTGEVRRIDNHAIDELLRHDNMVLLSNLGFSPTGEVFNLKGEEIATRTAIQLKADKLIMLTSEEGIFSKQGELISELLAKDAERLIDKLQDSNNTKLALQGCVDAVRQGVPRSHLISFNENGGLIRELFSREGAGTMIDEDSYEKLREATIDDVGGMVALLAPLEESGTLVRRSRKRLETEISQFLVVERDNAIIACAALYPFPEEKSGELACVAVDPNYRGGLRGDRLLKGIERTARKQGLSTLFLLTTRTAHWFLERGFEEGDLSVLPKAKKEFYNYQRNSKIFIRDLTKN
ncbi:amino-acid N-acetyltransferase [Marinomonas agarivorans]|nr:amino-acid N-acetyltransferase [Marinomonas agarivorans]